MAWLYYLINYPSSQQSSFFRRWPSQRISCRRPPSGLVLKHTSLHPPLIYLAASSYSTALLRCRPSWTSPQALHSLSLSRWSPPSMSPPPPVLTTRRTGTIFFRNDVAEAIAALPVPPLLIGDFKCVLMPADTAGTFRNKRCPPLADLVAAYDLTDGFYSLHPKVQSFTFFHRNTPGSRLNRAYIPPQLFPHLLAVTHPPSLLDYSALYVRLADVLQTAQPPPIHTSYWKFNTSLVKEEDFLPSFSAMWAALVAARAREACPATWWEN